MSLGAIFGLIFFIDWLIKSFIFGVWLGEHIMKGIYRYVCKQIDKCNYFGENYVYSKK